MRRILDFIRNEDGATALEYALIAGLIGLAVVASISSLSPVLQNAFASLSSKFN